MTHTHFWVAILLAGLLANCRTLTAATRRRRLVVERGGGDRALIIIAAQAVRGEAVTMAVQLLVAALVGAALAYPPPLAGDDSAAAAAAPEIVRVYLVCGWTLAACSVALTVDSLLDLRDRRRLVRELVRQQAVSGGTGDERRGS